MAVFAPVQQQCWLHDCLWGVVGAASTWQTTSAWRIRREPSLAGSISLLRAAGWRRCSRMASRLNPCGPAQTYMIGRVWACSCAAGFPSPSAVSPAGMGWRVWGCWALPSTIQGSVSSYRGTGFLRQTVCAQDEEGAPCAQTRCSSLSRGRGCGGEGRVHFPALRGCKDQLLQRWRAHSSISPWKDLVLWQSLYKFSLVATETHPFIAARCCFVKRVVHLCADLGDTGGPRHEVAADRNVDSPWAVPCGCLGWGTGCCRPPPMPSCLHCVCSEGVLPLDRKS